MKTASRPPTFALPRAAWVGALGVLALAIGWQSWRVGLNQDVRQTLGVLRAGESFGALDVWAHRPFATRLLMAVLAAFLPSDPVAADRVLRVLATLLALAASAALGHGLAQRLDRKGGGFIALLVGATLLIAPTWDFAEPEWFAAVGAATAVGVALSFGRRTGPVLAACLLAGVALLKFTTLPAAVVAGACVWAIDAERGRWIARTAAAVTPALFLLTLWLSPHEWQWVRDMPALNPAVTSALPGQLAEGWANHVLVSPMTLVALTVLTDMAVRGRVRQAAAGLGGLALLAVPFAAQHQGFLYHLAAVPVFGAAMVAAACVRAQQRDLLRGIPWTWLATGAIGSLAGVGVFAAGPRTRDGLWWIGLALTALAVVLPLAETAIARRGSVHTVSLVLAPLFLLPLLVTLSPRTAYSVSLAHSRVTPAVNRQQARDARDLAASVARVVPPDVPVLHLGFATPWQLPNPATCRYVSPTFLQRGNLPGVPATTSFRENLACVDDPAARFAIVQKDWFDPARVPVPVADAVRRNFPCTTPVYEDAAIRVCARG